MRPVHLQIPAHLRLRGCGTLRIQYRNMDSMLAPYEHMGREESKSWHILYGYYFCRTWTRFELSTDQPISRTKRNNRTQVLLASILLLSGVRQICFSLGPCYRCTILLWSLLLGQIVIIFGVTSSIHVCALSQKLSSRAKNANCGCTVDCWRIDKIHFLKNNYILYFHHRHLSCLRVRLIEMSKLVTNTSNRY